MALLKEIFSNKIEVYAFVGPSGTGKSYRAQMVAGEKGIDYIIDDGLLIKGNEVIAGESAKKAPTKIETVKQKTEEWRDKMMKKHIYDESNGLSYTLHGDYYLPDLAVNEGEPTDGKYGMLRKQFLKEH